MRKTSRSLCILIFASPLAHATGLADQVTTSGGGALIDQPMSALNSAQLVAAKGSSSASVKLSQVSSIKLVDKNGTSNAIFQSWSLTASSPLNKAGDDTDIATLDGLSNAASLELSFSRYRVPGLRNPVVTKNVSSLLDPICVRVLARMKLATGQSPDPTQGCDSSDVSKYGTSDEQHEYESAFWDIADTNRFIWGASAKLGYQQFEYINPSLIKKVKTNQTPWSVGAYVSYNPDRLRAVFTLSFQYQNAFKDADSGVVCPVTSTSPLICQSGPIGSVKESHKKLLSLAVRKAIFSGGLGLTATYDFDKRVSGIDVPVYLLHDKDGKYNGGLRASWRSDTSKFSLGLFVGTSFSLFN